MIDTLSLPIQFLVEQVSELHKSQQGNNVSFNQENELEEIKQLV